MNGRESEKRKNGKMLSAAVNLLLFGGGAMALTVAVRAVLRGAQ